MLVKESQNNWDESIEDILLAYRVTINMTIKETPFFLLYGRDAVLPSDLMFGTARNAKPDDTEDKFDYKIKLLNRLRTSYENIEQQRERRIYYKEQYDKTHKPVYFEVGSEVIGLFLSMGSHKSFCRVGKVLIKTTI
ncbi:Transposon Tf2-8 poly [Brachionus plicatilis]|uniref:Transposon Tf2-8 poly n=1 Tax=Brachionus plicatilis TaxID=10195 RepID=A0A3M7RC39_BRAPC|nr:Transposon Tf2-8 poly [Brachionus plicatilis]